MTDPQQKPESSDSLNSTRRRANNVAKRLGKFEIVGEIGRGGMGVVFEARDTVLERHVAIKLLPATIADQPESLERFLREARAAARLHHPNVVAVYDADEVDGQYYIVLELIRGGSLQDILKSGPLSWPEASEIIRQACRGLEVAHQAGLIHRDIKPSNLLRADDGTIKLADFGLARENESTGTTMTGSGSVLGTPQYMSPEQCRSERADERSDLYALGATYYSLLTGRPPFSGAAPLLVMNAHLLDPVPDPRDVNPDIPAECSAIIQRAMEKDPDDRYPNAGAMLVDLEHLCGINASSSWPTPPSANSSRPGSASRGTRSPRAANVPSLTDTSAPHNQSDDSNSTELSWGTTRPRSAASRTMTPSRPNVTSQAASATGIVRLRRRLTTGAIVTLLFPLLIGIWWLQPESSTDDSNSTESVAVREANPESAPSSGNQPARPTIKTTTQRTPLNHLIAALPDDAFLLPDMNREDSPSGDPDSEIWSMRYPGLVRVGMTNNGAFLVALTNAAAPDQTALAHVDVWRRDGSRIFSESLPRRATSLALSADSNWLAVGCEDNGGAVLWNTSNWQRLELLSATSIDVDAIALSDDGHWLACTLLTNQSDAEWHLYDLHSRTQSQRIVVSGAKRLRAIAFAPDDDLLVVTGGDDGYLRMWSGTPIAEVMRPQHTGHRMTSLALRPQGEFLTVCSGPRWAIWNYRRMIRNFVDSLPSNEATTSIFSLDGSLICMTSGPVIQVAQVTSPSTVTAFNNSGATILSVAFFPDASRFVAATADGMLKLYWLAPRGSIKED